MLLGPFPPSRLSVRIPVFQFDSLKLQCLHYLYNYKLYIIEALLFKNFQLYFTQYLSIKLVIFY